MEILHKGKTYELMELIDNKDKCSFDIVGIFESKYFNDETNEQIFITNEQFENDNNARWELGQFINYFYGANEESIEEIIKIAKDYIDEYLEKQAKIDHEKELKNAYCDAFKKASKKDFGSREMEELETKQYELLDYVLEIGLKENEDEER
jgi:hypothetical protein